MNTEDSDDLQEGYNDNHLLQEEENINDDTSALLRPFITYSEIKEISQKSDFRVAFGLHQEGDNCFRVGKQVGTSFVIGGIEDAFNAVPKVETFESFLEVSTSWNLFRTLRGFNGAKIFDKQTIMVHIQDTLDIVSPLMESCVTTFINKGWLGRLPKETYDFFLERLENSGLSPDDCFLYFVRFLYEYLLTTGEQKAYSLLEYFFEESRLPLAYVVGKFDVSYFGTFSELKTYFTMMPIRNRRECVQYTLEFRDDNLWDTFTLTSFLKKMTRVEQMEANAFGKIADAIKKLPPKREVVFTVNLVRAIALEELDLKALGLKPNTKAIVEHSYEIKLENFLVDSLFPAEFSYRNLSENASLRKVVGIAEYVQFTEIENLLAGVFSREVIYDAILNVSKGELSVLDYVLNNVIVHASDLDKNKKATLCKDDQIVRSVEYRARKQNAPRHLVGRELAILNVPIKTETDFTRETNDGLYEHQVRFIDRGLETICSPESKIVIYSAVVGDGKTTAVASLSYAIKLMHLAFKKRKRTLIYTTWSMNVLKEVFIKAKQIGLNILSSFAKEGGRLTIKFADDTNNSKSLPFESIVDYDMLICHPLILLKHLAVYDSRLKATQQSMVDNTEINSILDDCLVVIDELGSGRLNSTPEHVLGALLAYKPKHLAILSASIQKEKHVNYLRSLGNLTVIGSASILTPTSLRQLDGKPMDIFCWQNGVPLSKVLTNSFLKRFLTAENVKLQLSFVEMMQTYGVFDVATSLEVWPLFSGRKSIPSVGQRKDWSQEDETECIKTSDYYTLVLTDEPRQLACEHYGVVIRQIESFLESKLPSIEDLFSEEKALDQELNNRKTKRGNLKTKNPSMGTDLKACYRDTKATREVAIKVADIAERKKDGGLSVDDNGCLIKTFRQPTAEQRLHLLSMGQQQPGVEQRFSSEQRAIFNVLADGRKLSKQQEDILERMLVPKKYSRGKRGNDQTNATCEEELTESSTANNKVFRAFEENMLIQLSGIELLSAKEMKIRDMLMKRGALLEQQSGLVGKKDSVIADIRNAIAFFLDKQRIRHKFAPSFHLEDILKWAKQKPQEYIWELLGVFIESRKHTNAPNRPLNRLFAGEGYCRGIDLAIEHVIITQSFALGKGNDGVSADSLLQGSGRCGRPGKSKISIVSTSADVYHKMYSAKSSNDVEKIIQRANFYLQKPTQVDVLEAPLVNGENNRLQFLQERLKS